MAYAIEITKSKTILYHCELNPIEIIWIQIKNYVIIKNIIFKFAEIKILFLRSVKYKF